ncbi:non-heme iron oxygenase ferredoxin subunit [Arcanobacterium hippocoleae]
MKAEDVCAVTDVAAGEAAGFIVRDDLGAELKIALVHTESGNWYAVTDRCSHGRVQLSEGFVEDECIECPRHGAIFDLSSGNPLSPPASVPIRTYPVKLIAGRVYVEV